ncbi:MAG: hypothetical protein LBQ80_03185 [Clostridium sp.]|jgi:pilin isopeptide linkage protein|nr:hypothetical protein [Clostridium sp.]
MNRKRVFTAVLTVIMAMILVLSLVNFGSAWYDFTQSRTNDFSGIVENPPEDYDSIYVEIEKKLAGDEPTQDAYFSFTLLGLGDVPMPQGSSDMVKTATVLGEGKASFGRIIFTEPGTYVYTIKEQSGTTAGYGYDSSVFTLSVEVGYVPEDDESSTLPEEAATAAETDSTSEETSVNTTAESTDTTESEESATINAEPSDTTTSTTTAASTTAATRGKLKVLSKTLTKDGKAFEGEWAVFINSYVVPSITTTTTTTTAPSITTTTTTTAPSTSTTDSTTPSTSTTSPTNTTNTTGTTSPTGTTGPTDSTAPPSVPQTGGTTSPVVPSTTAPDSGKPDTGDTVRMFLWLALMLGSLVCLLVLGLWQYHAARGYTGKHQKG